MSSWIFICCLFESGFFFWEMVCNMQEKVVCELLWDIVYFIGEIVFEIGFFE